ncbi:hypothetical protein D3C86_1214030 [compost metagenome]
MRIYLCDGYREIRLKIPFERKKAIRLLLEQPAHEHKEDQSSKAVEKALPVAEDDVYGTSYEHDDDAQRNRNVDVEHAVADALIG